MNSSVQFSSSVISNSLRPHRLQHARLSITNSQSVLKLTSIKSVMPSNPLSSVIPFSSCLQSFPASGSFPMSRFFTSGGQSIGVSTSASVLPMNIQDWFPLGLTGLISIFNCRFLIWLFDVNICSTDTFNKCTNTLLWACPGSLLKLSG